RRLRRLLPGERAGPRRAAGAGHRRADPRASGSRAALRVSLPRLVRAPRSPRRRAGGAAAGAFHRPRLAASRGRLTRAAPHARRITAARAVARRRSDVGDHGVGEWRVAVLAPGAVAARTQRARGAASAAVAPLVALGAVAQVAGVRVLDDQLVQPL